MRSQETDIQLTIRLDDAPDTYCVYEHYVLIGDPLTPEEIARQHQPYQLRFKPLGLTKIYIGMCRLRQVFDFHDARRNTTWIQMIRPETDVYINIIATGPRGEMLHKWSSYLMACGELYQPVCNRFGFQDRAFRSRASIICSDGRQFNTQHEAAKALGVDQSRVSAHLNGKPGYRTVKGLTLHYGGQPLLSPPTPDTAPIPAVTPFPPGGGVALPPVPIVPPPPLVPPVPVSGPLQVDIERREAERAAAALAALARTGTVDEPDSGEDMK